MVSYPGPHTSFPAGPSPQAEARKSRRTHSRSRRNTNLIGPCARDPRRSKRGPQRRSKQGPQARCKQDGAREEALARGQEGKSVCIACRAPHGCAGAGQQWCGNEAGTGSNASQRPRPMARCGPWHQAGHKAGGGVAGERPRCKSASQHSPRTPAGRALAAIRLSVRGDCWLAPCDCRSPATPPCWPA